MSVRANMNPRRLDQRVTFQEKTDTINAATGARDPSFSDFTTCYAAVDATRANEIYAAEQKLPARDYTVWIYWRDDINANMRIKWGTRILEIVGIPDNQKRGLFLSVFCIEGRSQA